MNLNFSTPKKTTWIVCLVLGVIALIASLFTIPVLTDLAPWIAIVGLAPDADPGSIVSLMAAGVDDCVGKRAGFVDMLPGILRRACGHREAPASDDRVPRVLYSGDAIEPIRPSAPPQSHHSRIRRGMTTGAASFLLRDLLDSLPSGDVVAGEKLPGNPVVAGERSSLLHGQTNGSRIPEAGFPEAPAAPEVNAAPLELPAPAARSLPDGERAFPEDPCGSAAERLRVTEEERLLLLESVRDLQAHLARQAEEFQSERRQWELWRAALQKRLAEVETIALRIEDARQELERERRGPDRPEGTHNR